MRRPKALFQAPCAPLVRRRGLQGMLHRFVHERTAGAYFRTPAIFAQISFLVLEPLLRLCAASTPQEKRSQVNESSALLLADGLHPHIRRSHGSLGSRSIHLSFWMDNVSYHSFAKEPCTPHEIQRGWGANTCMSCSRSWAGGRRGGFNLENVDARAPPKEAPTHLRAGVQHALAALTAWLCFTHCPMCYCKPMMTDLET